MGEAHKRHQLVNTLDSHPALKKKKKREIENAFGAFCNLPLIIASLVSFAAIVFGVLIEKDDSIDLKHQATQTLKGLQLFLH